MTGTNNGSERSVDVSEFRRVEEPTYTLSGLTQAHLDVLDRIIGRTRLNPRKVDVRAVMDLAYAVAYLK